LFNVPVTSEDAGELVFGLAYLDYTKVNTPSSRSSFQNLAKLPAGTLDDGPRPFTLNVLADPNNGWTPGCHRLTLILTHESNVEIGRSQIIDTPDQAWAVWWLNVDADDPNVLENCPKPAGRAD
jgi:hypothetical protein